MMISGAKHNKGFTFIEIMIVVTVIGLVAMIVIPKFLSASDDAKESALITDLATLRRQIQLYRFEHLENGPHINEKGRTDAKQLTNRLLQKTDPNGKINANGTCGPYLKDWPANPFCDEKVAQDVDTGTKTSPPRTGKSGWYYNTDTCVISPNSTTGGESLDPPSDSSSKKKK